MRIRGELRWPGSAGRPGKSDTCHGTQKCPANDPTNSAIKLLPSGAGCPINAVFLHIRNVPAEQSRKYCPDRHLLQGQFLDVHLPTIASPLADISLNRLPPNDTCGTHIFPGVQTNKYLTFSSHISTCARLLIYNRLGNGEQMTQYKNPCPWVFVFLPQFICLNNVGKQLFGHCFDKASEGAKRNASHDINHAPTGRPQWSGKVRLQQLNTGFPNGRQPRLKHGISQNTIEHCEISWNIAKHHSKSRIMEFHEKA